MKVLIVLAAVLLVPIVMKFQQRDFEHRHEDALRVKVEEVLKAHGVKNPRVFQHYLDARISGLVDSQELANEIGDQVQRIRGVRLAQNDLKVLGWLEAGRSGEKLVVNGLLPEGWIEHLLKGQASGNVVQSGLKEAGHVLLPGSGATRWGVFLDDYFRTGGLRTFSLQAGVMTLSGEATPSLAERWKAKAGALGHGEVVDEFQLYPSPFHFPLRQFESDLEVSQRLSLQRKLANAEVFFSDGEANPTNKGRSSLSEWVGLILNEGSKARFAVGVHPFGEDNGQALEQARKVREWLVEQGVEGWALEAVEFEVIPGEQAGEPGAVEIFIR